MLKCVEEKIDKVKDFKSDKYSIELKVDGSRQFWIGDDFYSDRKVKNTDKFAHLSKFLKGKDVTLDGEIYIEGKTVIDLNRKINWNKAKFCVFDILFLNHQDLRELPLIERQKILDLFIKSLNTDLIHTADRFYDVETAWGYIIYEGLEGIVLKNLNSTYSLQDLFHEDRRKSWIKVKHFKSGFERIVDYEQGSVKGAFILANGSRISALKPEIANIWLKAKDNCQVFADFEFLNRTENNSYFQSILKRLINDKGEVIYE